jgi:hypothetical protein
VRPTRENIRETLRIGLVHAVGGVGAWTNLNGWLSGALFGAISDFQVRVDEAHVAGEQHRRAGPRQASVCAGN